MLSFLFPTLEDGEPSDTLLVNSTLDDNTPHSAPSTISVFATNEENSSPTPENSPLTMRGSDDSVQMTDHTYCYVSPEDGSGSPSSAHEDTPFVASDDDYSASEVTATDVTASTIHRGRFEYSTLWFLLLFFFVAFNSSTRLGDLDASALTFQKLGKSMSDQTVDLSQDAMNLQGGANVPRIPFVPFPIPTAPLAEVATDSPRVAWFLGFPNSGTTIVSRLVRESTNSSVGTNYPTPGKPTVPLLPGTKGKNGPFLDIVEGEPTELASNATVLTYSHCAGSCSREDCRANEDIVTPRAFLMGCLSGTRVERQKDGKLVRNPVTYSTSLVTKAVHMFRHPHENVVARFKEQNAKLKQDNATGGYAENIQGFREWCAKSDTRHLLDEDELRIDPLLRRMMKKTPCFHEFYRYVQWHNLAFSATRSLNLPTVIVHYRDFDEDLVGTRDKLVDFLSLPLVDSNAITNFNFQPGNKREDHYLWYYTVEDLRAVVEFVKVMASAETWQQLHPYFEGVVYH